MTIDIVIMESDKYFCSQSCKSQWLNVNMENIERGIPIPFIRDRRITEGYEKVRQITRWGSRYVFKKYLLTIMIMIGLSHNRKE